ncbi:hypothetical protein QVL70_07515, partial [Bartonella henselae]
IIKISFTVFFCTHILNDATFLNQLPTASSLLVRKKSFVALVAAIKLFFSAEKKHLTIIK